MAKLEGKELEAAIENRQAARRLAEQQAISGDGICGAMFTLESIAHAAGLGYVATTAQDFSDENDEERPF